MLEYPVLSADGHLDLPVLPADLFTSCAPIALSGRMPHVVNSDEGKIWVNGEGERLALVGGSGNTGQRYNAGESRRLDRMNESGFWDDLASGTMHPADPDLRVAVQDRDGIAGEVIYGILGICNQVKDPEVSVSVLRIYNDFMADFVARRPDRFAGIGCLPSGAPEVAADEVRRCAEIGLQGVEIALTHDLMPLWRSEFAPLWGVAAEVGIPVHLHTIGPPIDIHWATNKREIDAWMGGWLTVFQLRMVERVAELIFGGVLHANPNLKVVLGESGIGWLPYILERMDLEWEERLTHLELSMPPSDYWRRQMFATFQLDAAGLAQVDRIGAETLMWGNDFPHGDGVWPDSIEHIEKQFAGVDDAVRRKITFENAAALYGFPSGED